MSSNLTGPTKYVKESHFLLRRGPRAVGGRKTQPGQEGEARQEALQVRAPDSLVRRNCTRVLARLEEPYCLIIETCIATGARISEVLGLKRKHVNFKDGTIKIEQRVWHQDVGPPKSEDSKRILGIGDLVERYRAKANKDGATPDAFVLDRSGTRACATRCTRPRKPRTATSLVWGRTRSAGPTSPGGSRSAAAPSRRRRSLATATSK